jgi:hypothetical protein
MREHQCSHEQVLKDLAGHEMHIIKDDGPNRHIRFKRYGSSDYWFDLVTYQGALVIDGDCGTYVFRRLDDMFEFFRTDRCDGKLRINPSYWGEKLTATANCGGHTEFDEDRFAEVIKECLVRWAKDNRDDTSKEQRRELWDTVQDEVLEIECDQEGNRKMQAAYDFYHRVSPEFGDFSFQDLWEYNFHRYTFHFIWCCYAIAWAIELYDETKASEQKAIAA